MNRSVSQRSKPRAEDAGRSTGNAALQDQVAALRSGSIEIDKIDVADMCQLFRALPVRRDSNLFST
jgi:hypothetical protein